MLTIYTSNRLDTLVDRLAAETALEPLPPLEREIVVVQSEGMQRWLTLELAVRQGIAASLTTPFPRPFCHWLGRRVLDREDVPLSEAIPRGDDSLFGRDMLSWRLFGHLGDLDGSAALRDSAPAAYLAEDADQRKRFQLAQRLGSLYDDYQMFRPEMLDAWQRGELVTERDGAKAELWQAELWRRLVWSADGDEPFSRRLTRLTRRLGTATKEPAGLPRRLWVLGVSTLPPAFVELLTAVARWRPVGVLFVSPTYHYWGDLRSDREQAYLRRRLQIRGSRDAEIQHLERGNALLAALGRQGREFFDILQEADRTGAAWHDLRFSDPAEDEVGARGARPLMAAPASVLARIQSDILHLVDRSDPEGPGPVPWPGAAGDHSLEVHACHAPMREMEVLKDRLLGAFAEDDRLSPSDVLVLVPDIELYGPYIQAVFGGGAGAGAQGGGRDAPEIQFSIADRRAGKEQPPSETILDVLDLVRSRATMREIFDLLDTPAVRRRFGLESSDLPDLRRLAEETRVRWGFDGAHRHRVFDVPLVEQNTWRAGLDRLVMGYATGADGLEELVDAPAGRVLPFAGDTAGAVEVLGRFVRFVETLTSVLEHLRTRRSFGGWADALLDTVDRLFAAESDDEELGLQAIRDAADELRRLASVAQAGSLASRGGGSRAAGDQMAGSREAGPRAGSHEAGLEGEGIHLQVVREHLGTVLSAEGFASGFLAGKVTFCALRPMRTIPFRVIAIAGLDDGAFPRRDRRPGFDLMAPSRRQGDRSLRDDDRYLFLETILAARSRLILSYVGFSQRDATRREPSVVLSELLDQVDRTFVLDDGAPARSQVIVEHPLQPWSAGYYSADGGVPRSFDESQRRAAEALRHGGDSVPGFAPTAFSESDAGGGDVVELTVDDLVRFWSHPTQVFCRHLGLMLDSGGASEDDAEPFVVGGLDGFAVRQWLLERRIDARASAPSSTHPDAAHPESPEELRGGLRDEREILRAQGLLPPGELGDSAWNELHLRVEDFAKRIPEETRLDALPIEIHGGSAVAWRLGGRVGHRTARGLLHYRCGGLRAADRIRTWIEHLALVACGDANGARLLGENQQLRFAPPADAVAVFDSLVDGYIQGLRRPLPVVAETSLAWAEQARALADPRRRVAKSPRDAARQVFEGQFRVVDSPEPEAGDPYVRQCFRDLELLDHPEAGRWAERLWWPIFDHMREAS